MPIPHTFEESRRLWIAKNTVAWVNGHRIRTIPSRFGTLFHVDGLNRTYTTFTAAKVAAGGGL